MIGTINANDIKIGQKVNYGFLSNVTFEGFDEKGNVIIKYKSGNIKKVYKNSFEKMAKIVND